MTMELMAGLFEDPAHLAWLSMVLLADDAVLLANRPIESLH